MLNKNGGEESARFGVFRSDDDACLIIVAFRAYTLIPPLFGALPCSSLIWPAVLLWAESNLIPQSHPQQLPTESESFYFDEEKKFEYFLVLLFVPARIGVKKKWFIVNVNKQFVFWFSRRKKMSEPPLKKLAVSASGSTSSLNSGRSVASSRSGIYSSSTPGKKVSSEWYQSYQSEALVHSPGEFDQRSFHRELSVKIGQLKGAC